MSDIDEVEATTETFINSITTDTANPNIAKALNVIAQGLNCWMFSKDEYELIQSVVDNESFREYFMICLNAKVKAGLKRIEEDENRETLIKNKKRKTVLIKEDASEWIDWKEPHTEEEKEKESELITQTTE